jgi:hypothetical protein
MGNAVVDIQNAIFETSAPGILEYTGQTFGGRAGAGFGKGLDVTIGFFGVRTSSWVDAMTTGAKIGLEYNRTYPQGN